MIRKTLSYTLAAFMALALLSGCSSKDTDENGEPKVCTEYPCKPVDTGKISVPEDLSFLDTVSRSYLSDADQTAGSWYAGKTERDPSTGEVTYVWDRSPETIDMLKKYGAIYRKNEDQPVVYFTFDCGYENGVTPKILDVLKEKGVKGTFFITGAYIESNPELVQRMYDEGHIVGTHTNHHYDMTQLSAEEFINEITSNQELLNAALPDAPDMTFYRPPMGSVSEWTLALAQAMGLTTTLWSFTQYDYDPADQPDPALALQNAESSLHNGAVYLLHAVSETNAQILPELIDYIQSQGFEIRPLNDPDTAASAQTAEQTD